MKVTARPYFSVLISDSGRADSKRASGLENNRRREKARSINNGEKSIFVVRVRRRRRRSRGEIRQSIYRSAIHSSHVHAGETRNSIGTPCSAQVCVRTRQPFLPPAEFPLSPPVSSCRPKTVAEVREKIRDGERERERRGVGVEGRDQDWIKSDWEGTGGRIAIANVEYRKIPPTPRLGQVSL